MSRAHIKVVSELNPSNAASNVHLLKDSKPTPVILRYPCRFCGQKHAGRREVCPAWGKKCKKCGKDNHFVKKCPLSSSSKRVSVVVVEDELPVFPFFKVATSQSSDSNLVTLKVPGGNFILFEIDTGARCNVLPAHIYKKATGDFYLKQVNPARSSFVSYDGGNIAVLGTVKIQGWRGSFTCLLL